MRLFILPALALLPLLAACDPKVGDDTGPSADTDTDTDADSDTDTDADSDTDTDVDVNFTLVGTTTDYTTGALVTISSEGVLTDSVIPVSGDSAVRAFGSRTYVLNRSAESTVQRFDDLDFSAPAVEFSTGDGSNPHDVAECGGSLVVSLFAGDALMVVDPATGLQTGSVDLSAFDDGDGSPEPDSMFVAPNGFLYVALNQLAYYVSADGSGTLAKVDCSTWQVVDSWDVGPDPMLQPDPTSPDGLILTGGDYFNADYSAPALDGGLWLFDTASDALTGPFLTEVDLGANLGGVVGSEDGHLVTTINDGYVWSLVCLDRTDWSMVEVDLGNAYIGAMTSAPDGSVWAAVGYGYASSGAGPSVGFTPVDPVGCVPGTAIPTALGPSSIAVVVQ